MELESKSLKKDPGFDFEQELPVLLRPKKTRYDHIYDHRAPISYPIKVHEVSHSLELEWPNTSSSKQWRYATERSLSLYVYKMTNQLFYNTFFFSWCRGYIRTLMVCLVMCFSLGLIPWERRLCLWAWHVVKLETPWLRFVRFLNPWSWKLLQQMSQLSQGWSRKLSWLRSVSFPFFPLRHVNK